MVFKRRTLKGNTVKALSKKTKQLTFNESVQGELTAPRVLDVMLLNQRFLIAINQCWKLVN